jgi:hypothetical protein
MGTNNKHDGKTKSPEKKSGFFGGGVVWLFVLMAIAILVVVTYNSTTANVEIAYSDLEALIKASTPADDGSVAGKIRVNVGPFSTRR